MKFVKLIKSSNPFKKTLMVEHLKPTKDENTGEEINAKLTLLEGIDIIDEAYCYLEFEENTNEDLIKVAQSYFDVDYDIRVVQR